MSRPHQPSGPHGAHQPLATDPLAPGAPDLARGASTGVAWPPAIDSRELLRGGRMIEIDHEGTVYRLQATRLGKLILTK